MNGSITNPKEKNTMKKIAAFVALAVLLTASSVFAQDQKAEHEGHKHHHGMGHHGMMGMMGGGMKGMLDKLNLTAEQKTQAEQIFKESKDKVKPLREQMKQAFKGMRDVMAKTPGDEAAVRQAAQAVAKAGEDLAVLKGQTKAKIDAILTPEQKAKRDELMAKFKDKIKERIKEHKGELGKALKEGIEKKAE